jgi:hypothetical protein
VAPSARSRDSKARVNILLDVANVGKYLQSSKFWSYYFVISTNYCIFAANNKNREEMEHIVGLNAAQLDFLQLLAHIKTMEELDELRQVVSDFYARKAEDGMNKLWESGQWSKEKDEEMLRTHLRTPYKYAK